MQDKIEADTYAVDVPLAFYEWLSGIERDAHIHDLTPEEQVSLVEALTPPAGDVAERIAQFVREWNGSTEDGNTFLIADEIEEQFSTPKPEAQGDSGLVGELRAEIEGLRFVARVIEDPDQQLCCDGRECGCMGSTVGQYAAWAMKPGEPLASIDKVRADALEARLIEAAETKGFLSVEDIRALSKQEK